MDVLNFNDVYKIIDKRKYVLISIVLTAFVLVTIYFPSIDPLYRAKAKILIGLGNSKVVQIEGAEVQGSRDNDFLNTQYDLLRSRSLARNVIKKLNLENHEEFKPKPSLLNWKTFKIWMRSVFGISSPHKFNERETFKEDPYTSTIDEFLKRLKISPVKNSEIVDIYFEFISPVVAANITNTLAETFISKNLELQFSKESDAEKWLKIKVEDLAKEVKHSEIDLQNYKKNRNFIEVLDVNGKRDFSAEKVNQVIKEYIFIKAERLRYETLYHELKKLKEINIDPIKVMLSVPIPPDNETFLQFKKDYLELKNELKSSLKSKTTVHPDVILLQKKLNILIRQIPNEIEQLTKSMQINYKSALVREIGIGRHLERDKQKVINTDSDAIQFNLLRQKVDSNKKLYDLLSNRLQELGFSSKYTETNIRIVDLAEVPLKPFKPNTKMYFGFALAIGLFLGLGVVFFLESIDDYIRIVDDVNRYFPFPVMGSIRVLVGKEVKYKKGGGESELDEEFHDIRNNLLSRISKNNEQVIMITSSVPAEGKTTTASDLARAFAQMGKKVLLLDADFKNPKIHQLFGTPVSPGLLEGFSDPDKLNSMIYPTNFKRVWVAPAGRKILNTSLTVDILISEFLNSFVLKSKKVFDIILIKAPPVLSASEASVIEKVCERILFVVESGLHKKQVIQLAIEKLFPYELKIKKEVLSRRAEDKYNNWGGTSGGGLKKICVVLNKVIKQPQKCYGNEYNYNSVPNIGNPSFVEVFLKNRAMLPVLFGMLIILFSILPSYPLKATIYSIPMGDYFAHFFTYSIFMFCLCKFWFAGKNQTQLELGLILIFMGVLLEVLQIPVAGRVFDVFDICAGILGVISGYAYSKLLTMSNLDRQQISRDKL